MKRLFYLRHGLSELNLAGLFAGSTDTPLTEDGILQAYQAGQQAKGVEIDRIIASPLSRAHQTAIEFAKGAGLKLKIELDPLLKERDFGSLEKTPWSHEVSSSLLNDNLPKGVESWDHLVNRARKMLEKIEKMPEDNILIVSHGATGRAMKYVINSKSDWHSGLPNAQLITLIK